MKNILQNTLDFFKRNTYLLRLLISGLFLLSAVAKLYPSIDTGFIIGFEMKQLRADIGFSKEIAQYVSRFILAAEIFIAFAILQANFLKRIIIPLSTLLLIGFSIHLFIGVIQGKTGNCGCFGELIPMTPLQALIKNIATIFILYFIFRYTKNTRRSNLSFLLLIFILSSLFMFIVAPLRSFNSSIVNLNTEEKSVYSKYVAGIDRGESLLCFFAAGCDHCQEAAKAIVKLENELECFPDVNICFLDEETDKIPKFFEDAGAIYNYKILEMEVFWDVFYSENDNPGVIYLDNGELVKFYQGTEEGGSENMFDADDLRTILENR